ncbi:MAG TPA: hypothetical protein V6C58_12910 [Allocoleopsis sp.]
MVSLTTLDKKLEYENLSLNEVVCPIIQPITEQKEDEIIDNRGLLSLKHHQDILFSQELEIATQKLSLWKPHITLVCGGTISYATLRERRFFN